MEFVEPACLGTPIRRAARVCGVPYHKGGAWA